MPEALSFLGECCRNIEELSIVFGWKDSSHIFQSLSSQITSLFTTRDPKEHDLDVIATHYKRLVRLEIDAPDRGRKQFFAIVGPQLKHLRLLSELTSAEVLTNVTEHCRGLVSLKLDKIDHGVLENTSALIRSYSTCLKRLCIGKPSSLTLCQYQEIARDCPVLDWSISCEWNQASSVLNGLGDRLVVFCIKGTEASDKKALRSASAKSTRMLEIHWGSENFKGIESLKCILPQAKGSLSILKIGFHLRSNWGSDMYKSEIQQLERCTWKSQELGIAYNFLETVDMHFISRALLKFALNSSKAW